MSIEEQTTPDQDFGYRGVIFRSRWVLGAEHDNAGHFERVSGCGRIVCRRTEGSAYHEVTVDGGRKQGQLASMRAAIMAGLDTLNRLKSSTAT